MKRPTLNDIAEATGKSIATVSRVLNNKELDGIPIAEATALLIRETAEKMHYIPNDAARALSSAKSEVLGLIIPDITSAYFSTIASCLQEEAEKAGYILMILNTGEDADREAKAVETLLRRRPDGLFIAPSAGGEHRKLFTRLASLKVPVVLLDRNIPDFPVPCVTNSNIDAAFSLTHHLIEQGCKKILMIYGDPGVSVSAERLEGYRQALTQHGIDFNENLVCASGYFENDGYISVLEKTVDGVKFDGVIGVNDMVAVGVLKALIEKEIEIPAAIKVAGFGNLANTDFLKVSLTTVNQHPEKVAAKAFEVLQSILDHEQVDLAEKVDCELIVRESTGGE